MLCVRAYCADHLRGLYVEKNIMTESNKSLSSESRRKRDAENASTLDAILPRRAKNAASQKLGKEKRKQIGTPLSVIQPGLTITCVRDHKQLAQVRNTMTHEAVKMSTRLVVPMPALARVLSLHAGHGRCAESAKLLAAANRPANKDVEHLHRSFEAHGGMDWTSSEGLAVLLPIIKKSKGGCIAIEQPINDGASSIQEFGLGRISAAAKEHDVLVMLFAAHPDGRKADLSKYCSEYFDAAPCQPDPGFNIAFSIECADVNNSGELDVGKVMCCVKLVDGKFKRRYRPFISADGRTRLMAMLREDSTKTLQEIGDTVGLSKSQVSRILAKVPRIGCGRLSKGDLNKWLDACGIDPDEPVRDGDI